MLSAKSDAALRAAGGRLLSFLDAGGVGGVEGTGVRSEDVAFSLATSRAVLERRAVVVGEELGEFRQGLEAIVSGAAPVGGAVGGKVGFLFSGQGSQRIGMGRELYDVPVFAAAYDEVCALLDAPVDVDAEQLDQTGSTQPALFASRWRCSGFWSRGASGRISWRVIRWVRLRPRTWPGCCRSRMRRSWCRRVPR
ncbi:hypothetical protein ACWKT5_37010 [Streptomyces avermitilis]